MSQRSLMGRIVALSYRIFDMQRKFDLPKGHEDRWETYGGAQSLQRARQQRTAAQAQLEPFRIIATGVSCRDCRHFADVDGPTCWRFGMAKATKDERSNDGDCGPKAELFAHA